MFWISLLESNLTIKLTFLSFDSSSETSGKERTKLHISWYRPEASISGLTENSIFDLVGLIESSTFFSVNIVSFEFIMIALQFSSSISSPYPFQKQLRPLKLTSKVKYSLALKIWLCMAEPKAAPLAIHSLEFKVLEGSISNESETSLMMQGILEPPPMSSMCEISTPSSVSFVLN